MRYAGRAMVPEALVAIVLGVAACWFVTRIFAARKRQEDRTRYGDATDEERSRSYAMIRSVSQDSVLRPGTVETALFLLDEAKAAVDRARATSDGLASKATTLLSLAAGASGALGVVATSHSGKPVPATLAVVAAMACLLITICCSLYILRGKAYDRLDVGALLSAPMIAGDNRCGLALTMALAHWRMAQQLRYDIRNEPRTLFAACASLMGAAALILIHVAALG
jgi:hypothetical protein